MKFGNDVLLLRSFSLLYPSCVAPFARLFYPFSELPSVDSRLTQTTAFSGMAPIGLTDSASVTSPPRPRSAGLSPS